MSFGLRLRGCSEPSTPNTDSLRRTPRGPGALGYGIAADDVPLWVVSAVWEDGVANIDDAGAAPNVVEKGDLFIGLVRAIGTELNDTIEALRVCFGRAGYAKSSIHHLKLSSYLSALTENDAVGPETRPELSTPDAGRYRYYSSRMDAGDWVRQHYAPGVLAQCAVAAAENCRERDGRSQPAREGNVFIFDSLMHRDEVSVMRSVYGRRFFLVAVHSQADDREKHLLDEIRSSDPEEAKAFDRRSDGSTDDEERRRFESRERVRTGQVAALMRRDEGLSDPASPFSPSPPRFRVSVRKTFAQADLFISASEAAAARRNDGTSVMQRFVEKLFDEPFHTPTRDELGMAHAYVAARRSGSLARNVGAALCNTDGEVLAVGTNEVPAPSGGQYWPEYDGAVADERDHRFSLPGDDASPGIDSNDLIKFELAADFARRLLAVLPASLADTDGQIGLFEEYSYNADDLLPRLLADDSVSGAQLFDVIEYSRHVHAEMAALMSCARRGVPTQATVLYTTTFPCHECSRHIIAAGVSRVVYVEPYEKSRVAQLHHDSVEVELYAGSDPSKPADDQRMDVERVRFEPFIGISPDRQVDVYSQTRRKIEAKAPTQEQVGRARHWSLSPTSELRSSIAADEATVGVGELMTIAAAERYVTVALSAQYSIHEDDLRSGFDNLRLPTHAAPVDDEVVPALDDGDANP